MNKLIKYYIALLLLVFQVSALSQEVKNIELTYVVNGKEREIKSNSKVFFIQNCDTIVSGICCNKLNIPSLDPTKNVDILFYFGEKELFFASIPVKKLLINQKIIWELGFFKKFGDKEKEEFYQVKDFSKLEELYYWKFSPQEYGDGTITLVTVPKN